MNNVYKLIWSVSQNAWIVCSELGRKKNRHVVLAF
ncbi:ESPR-type extended signal peptide-containing protein [Kluyvera ascorbata]